MHQVRVPHPSSGIEYGGPPKALSSHGRERRRRSLAFVERDANQSSPSAAARARSCIQLLWRLAWLRRRFPSASDDVACFPPASGHLERFLVQSTTTESINSTIYNRLRRLIECEGAATVIKRGEKDATYLAAAAKSRGSDGKSSAKKAREDSSPSSLACSLAPLSFFAIRFPKSMCKLCLFQTL